MAVAKAVDFSAAFEWSSHLRAPASDGAAALLLVRQRLLGGHALPRSPSSSSSASPAAAAAAAKSATSAASAGALAQRRAQHKPMVDLLAGVVAGLAVDVPLHPLDTLKTRLQAPGGLAAAGGGRGLWAGIGPVVLRAVPCGGIFFASYGHLGQQLALVMPKKDRGWGMLRDALAGAGANTVACVVRVPSEVLKSQMQAQLSHAPQESMSAAVRRIAQGGPLCLFVGFGPTVCRELAFAAIQMPLFERLRHAAPGGDDHSIFKRGLVSSACGGISGAVAGALTNPIDVVKTRVMIGAEHGGRSSVSHALASLREEGGARMLCRGMVPRTAYVGLSCALSFGAFECSKAALSQLLR